MPGVSPIPCPRDRCGNTHPRIKRGHRSVRAQGQSRPRIDQPAQRKRSSRAISPVHVGHVAIIDSVLGLNAGGYPELTKPGEIFFPDELGVLDPSAKTVLLEDVKDDAVCLISNGVDREPKTCLLSLGENGRNICGRKIHRAKFRRGDRQVGLHNALIGC